MLASIHPLGERARGQRYAVTATAYIVGSVLGAASLGFLVGGLGGLVFDGRAALARLIGFGVIALGAAGIEAAGGRVPSWHRQVNEDWLTAYRGWVYGAGFGFQLGLGVVTIVTTAAVYLTWLGACLSGGPATGAAIGAAFGLSRALPVLAGSTIQTPKALRDRVLTTHAWDGKFRVVTALVEGAAVAVAVVVAVAIAGGT